MCTSAIVRLAAPEWEHLRDTVFLRYPLHEWATFARFGWRETKHHLVLTLAQLDPPEAGDLDSSVGNVAMQEPYTLRIALSAEKHPLGVGIVHSHPRECIPVASRIDDDMDAYYSTYFADFAPGRPYVSLIVSMVNRELALSGRVHWRGSWLAVERFAIERTASRTWIRGEAVDEGGEGRERTKRFIDAFGVEAAARLRSSTVAVIGAGGTGSAAIEVLARAGVGRLIVVDPDHISASNLERVHGSKPEHVERKLSKVALAREHVCSIDPSCVVEGFIGALPQEEVLNAIVTADVVLGCTDQQHSRLALSDIAFRYLVPALDCGVQLEGSQGRVTGQIVQLVRFLAADPCALCRGMINASQVSQELMSPEERHRRQRAAMRASASGDDETAYWTELPQLNTVGYLTTTAGAMLAGYAIGWLTSAFQPPFERLQMNLVAPFLDVTDQDQEPRIDCPCRRVRGWADQGKADALITPPQHWPPVRIVHASIRKGRSRGESVSGV